MALVGLALKYWKYIAIILAVVAAYFFIVGKINDMKQEAYNRGVGDERARVIKLIREENARNRKFEEQLQDGLDKLGEKLDSKQRERVVRETIYRDRIVDILNRDPSQQCKTNPQVTTERNKIRAEFDAK